MSVRSIEARVNPVYLTAKTAVCLMVQAGIPDADKVVHALALENNAPLQNMKDAETILGNALVVSYHVPFDRGFRVSNMCRFAMRLYA